LSLITYSGLVELVDRGVIEGVEPGRINAASIDVTLGDVIWIEDANHGGTVDLARKFVPNMIRVEMPPDGFELQPGEFCLAQTREVFNLPDNIAGEFRLKSSGARSGLQQSLAVWLDPGWHGSVLTLELSNILQHHRLLLRPGMPIGQIILFHGDRVPEHASYRTRGQYCGDREAQPSKGIR
jgi:dCTP deaminase